jgi:hypothetical protein
MPVGGIRDAAADIQKRREAGQGAGMRWFKIGDGEQKVVRFLEEGRGIHWCWTHKMPPQGNQKWGDDIPCLNQNNDGAACPGCEQGIPKKFKGYINLIERDADKFAQNAEGRTDWNTVVGKEDQVMTWEQGITVFEELDGLDADYKGLMSRDFKISRSGTQLNTRYSIRPLDPAPMSEADAKLAEAKPDLKQKIEPGTYDDMQRRLSGGVVAGNANGGGNGGAQQGGGDINPFLSQD